MRKFVTAIMTLLLLQFCQSSFAQQKTVTGTVVSNDGTPVELASVVVKGKKSGTKTDEKGNFSISVSTGDVLIISAVNYTSHEVKIGSASNYRITLLASGNELEEVVVTAMDIKRNSRELPYSAQTIGGKQVKETQRENFLNSLQGRIAGATVNSTSGLAGASTSIVLRGFNSLSMSNQPLFVVDGIIVDNQTIDENSNGGSGVGMVERTGLTNTSNRNTDYTNRVGDVNPSDIESITVLKGPEATALYGSQASSGAIIITTKKGKTNKFALQYDNSFRVQKVTRFPEIIDQYENGVNGDTLDVFRYFGPAYAPGTKLYDNKKSFFKTGFSQEHNIGMDFGFKKSVFRFSTSLFDQSAVVPNNTYNRFNIRLSNTTTFGKYMDITPSVSYIRTNNHKVLRSAGGFLIGLLIWPGTNDITATQGDLGKKIPIFRPDNLNADYDNPLFNVNSNANGELTDRYTYSLGINIRPTDWLSIAGRFGYENYNTDGYLRYHPLSYYLSASTGGLQDNFYRKYNGYNHTITATATKKVNDFGFRLMLGTMWQDYKTEMYAVSGTGIVDSIVNGVMYKGGQVVTAANYGQLVGSPSDSDRTKVSTRNRLLRNVFGEYNQSILREIAYFGEFAVSYKNLAFLSYTHRFEQASTLPERNRNFNYPGAGLSLILSDIFPSIKKGPIGFVKLRGSIAATARLNSPYSTQSVFVNNLSSGGGFSYGFFNNNPDLMPEKQQTYEIGTEWRMFNNRLTFDASYYNTLNKGQIIENFRLSYGTGYVLNTQNAGSTRNQGVELTLDALIIDKTDFSWNTTFNFSKMWNKVVELPKNVKEYYIADTWLFGNARGGLQLDGSTTTITSYGYRRNDNGDILISPTTGLPVVDATFKVRGDRNPDFVLGFNNQITYKNWRLSFLWDFKIGGDIFNGTEQFLTTIGKSKLTEDRMTPRVIKGVLMDGLENTSTPTQNNISVTPYYNDLYYRSLPEEAFIEKNVNWARLRDISIAYSFAPSITKKIKGLKNLGLFLTINDLILITNYSGADPGVSGNTAGARGVGSFGFDYGTLPVPVSFNFGLRASF